MVTKGLLFLVLLCLIGEIVSPPVDPKKKEKPSGKDHQQQDENDDLGLEYGRYLQQVIQVLEQDEDFAKKLVNVSADAIKTGDVAHELEFVNHRVRTKLDELKRMELDRLRTLVRLEQNDLGYQRNKLKIPYHLDVKNPHTFEIEDLKQLIKSASKDLDDLNEKRKEEFKRYEMEKEHRYREELKHLNPEERKLAETKHQEMIARHKDHPQVHHPGSKQQLEQVWEEVDHLPRDEFDPKTFFRMHDINGDGYLDEEEVKALVALEVRKMYNISNADDDPLEMQEEFNRMEEHIFKEADKNNDRLISMSEFLDMTRRPDFEQDPGWKGLDEEQVYTPEELMEYERQLAAQAGYYPYQGGYPPDQYGQGGYHPNQQYAYHPAEGAPPNNQGVQFQPLPDHGQQQHPGQGQASQHSGQQMGQAHHQGQPMGQFPHPGQPMGQVPHPGQPMGQVPHPGQNMGQVPHPGQNMGQVPHPGQNMGQMPHPGQNMGQMPHPGQHMGQVPHPGQPMGHVPHQVQGLPPQGQQPVPGGGPPHYPPQYAPAGGAPPVQSQFGSHPSQPVAAAASPQTGSPNAISSQPGVPSGSPNAVPSQPGSQSGQVPSQPQAALGGNAQRPPV